MTDISQPVVIDWATFEDGEIAVIPARDLVRLLEIAERRVSGIQWKEPVSRLIGEAVTNQDSRLYTSVWDDSTDTVSEDPPGAAFHARNGWRTRLRSAGEIITDVLAVDENESGPFDHFEEPYLSNPDLG